MITLSPTPTILALDTSSMTHSLAITRGQEVLFEALARPQNRDSASLLRLVDQGLNYIGLKIGDIERFAVSRGPGAFTSLRVSMAMLKAFALTLDRPLYGLSTLEALAYDAMPWPGVVAAVIDARRGELYVAFYRETDGKIEALSDELLISPEQFYQMCEEEFGDEAVLCVGPALGQYEAKMRAASKTFQFKRMATAPRAAALARIVVEKHLDTLPTVALDALEPVYIRQDDFALPKAFDFNKPEQFRVRNK